MSLTAEQQRHLDERNEKIAYEYVEDPKATMASLGLKHNLSKEQIRQILQKGKVKSRPQGHVKGAHVTAEQKEKIIALRKEQKSIAKIKAEVPEVGRDSIKYVLRQAGVRSSPVTWINGPNIPRTCTKCRRTEKDGARFTPGRSGNQCAECSAAMTKEHYQRRKKNGSQA